VWSGMVAKRESFELFQTGFLAENLATNPSRARFKQVFEVDSIKNAGFSVKTQLLLINKTATADRSHNQADNNNIRNALNVHNTKTCSKTPKNTCGSQIYKLLKTQEMCGQDNA
jgi:hypothetical protein